MTDAIKPYTLMEVRFGATFRPSDIAALVESDDDNDGIGCSDIVGGVRQDAWTWSMTAEMRREAARRGEDCECLKIIYMVDADVATHETACILYFPASGRAGVDAGGGLDCWLDAGSMDEAVERWLSRDPRWIGSED